MENFPEIIRNFHIFTCTFRQMMRVDGVFLNLTFILSSEFQIPTPFHIRQSENTSASKWIAARGIQSEKIVKIDGSFHVSYHIMASVNDIGIQIESKNN